MFLAEANNENYAVETREKWKNVMDVEGLAPITDSYRRDVTLRLLENQEKFLQEAPNNIIGNSPSTSGGVRTWDPVLISMIRRAAPSLIAFDVMGVQPMTGPTGLIFSMRSTYKDQAGVEAGFNEADGTFSGSGAAQLAGKINLTIVIQVTGTFTDGLLVTGGTSGATAEIEDAGTLTAGLRVVEFLVPPTQTNIQFAVGEAVTDSSTGVGTVVAFHSNGMDTEQGQALGDLTNPHFNEMAFTIDRTTVEAKTRALKAEYSIELAQDLRAIHGMDAETELANILSQEITAEINREMINTLYFTAALGAQKDVTTAGTFDLDTDSNGRWSVERFKGLMFQLERDANAIARATRRGRGNVIVCSSDVASALSMAGKLDTTLALKSTLNVDDTGNTFAGVLNGKYKVYIDPYWTNNTDEFYMVGYKGAGFADAGAYYAPYVPLEMVRAVGENTFQPKIAFKTRYGVVANPYVNATGAIVSRQNQYYRRVTVKNVM